MLRRLVPIVLLVIGAAVAARADSPLTSTPFWKAYQDVPEVRQAHDIERLNTHLAYYLLSKAPIDRKAAVINALSWNFYGRQNAALFREVLGIKYKLPPASVDPRLTAEETFCLGYLTALDDYFHPKPALAMVEKARARLPKSFTVAIVDALIRAQVNFSHFERLWPIVRRVLDDRRLVEDMRPAGREIIVRYMRLYQKY
jgi:hypothetical protein